MKPSLVPAITRLPSTGETSTALTVWWRVPGTAGLACCQCAAPSVVRQSDEPPSHSRSGFEGSMVNGVMKRKSSLAAMPWVASSQCAPPSGVLASERPVFSA